MEFEGKIVKKKSKVLVFLLLRLQHFNSANSALNRGNTNPSKESSQFSDTWDRV
jgi:hypothetical protein